MVTMSTKIMTTDERIRARAQRVRDMARVPGVRVEPAGGEGFTADDMRRLLKHPKAGGFRTEGSIEWPNDTFTQRRLREGSIKLAEQKSSSTSGSTQSAEG